MKKKTILITGGSGYIGTNVREHLNQNYSVFVPGHRELDLVDSTAVERYFKTHRIDVVINCAVVGGSRAEEHVGGSVATNLRMFFNLVRSRKYFKKMIHLGSGAEYDKSRFLRSVSEDDFGKRVPADDYGFYKYVCGQYIENSADNIVNLRIFGLFGPGEDYRLRFISNMLVRSVLGMPLEMNQDAYFDYVYIKDFVRIVEHFIQYSGKYRSYNIGTGKRVRLSAIAQKMRDISGTKKPITIKKKGLNKEYTCDATRLLSELGGFQFTDFNEALRELYKWYNFLFQSFPRKRESMREEILNTGSRVKPGMTNKS